MKRLNWKKILVVMLLGILCLSYAGAAGSRETEQPGADEAVNVVFWHNYDAGAGQIQVLEDLIQQFEAQNPGITVEQQYFEWGALKNNVVMGASSGDLPDILRGDIGFIPQFQSLNVLVAMDEELADYAEVAQTVMEAPNSTAYMKGHNYGLAANTNTKILYYNKDMVPVAPRTLEEFWAAALKATDKDTIGICEAWMGGWNVCQYIWSEGGSVLAPDYSRAEGYINSNISVGVIEKMAQLHGANAFSGPTIDPGAPGDTDGMGSGAYAMTVDGPWKANDLASKYPEMNFGTALFPRGAAGSIGVLGGEDFMLFKTSDKTHRDAAWEFIKFMAGSEAQIAMAKVGQMPVNKQALASPDAVKAMPLLPLFSEALKTCRTRPVIPQWGEVSGIINTKTTEAVLGLKTARAAMDEAAAEIDALLAN